MDTLYVNLGGAEMVGRLVEAFYPRVYADPDLSPLFPDGVDAIKKKQVLFLTQFLGGPAHYSDQYGPPQMRQRHLAFEITPRRARAWLRCMKEAMDEIGLAGPERDWFYERLTQVAGYMVNKPGTADDAGRPSEDHDPD